jgi:hypothetical protein
MHWGRFTLATVFSAWLLLCTGNGFSQQPGMLRVGPSSAAQGTLTVTATIVSSVGLVIGPDGEQRLMIANATDPSDNVSRLQPVQILAPAPSASSPAVTIAPHKKKKR